jgi:hypothetical protein
MTKPEHFDRLNNKIELGDVVVFPIANNLYIGRITKLNPKMVKVEEIKDKSSLWKREYNKYSVDIVKVPEKDAIVFLLKNT